MLPSTNLQSCQERAGDALMYRWEELKQLENEPNFLRLKAQLKGNWIKTPRRNCKLVNAYLGNITKVSDRRIKQIMKYIFWRSLMLI